jgi:hypothetical protein
MKFQRHLDEASEIVSKWPAWRRGVLRDESISFGVHENNGKWVLRVYHANGFDSLGAINGKQEADLICRSLNLCTSDWASSADLIKKAWREFVIR